MTAFSVKTVVVYLLTLAPISVADRFRLLWDRFSQSEWALICFSSESSNKH